MSYVGIVLVSHSEKVVIGIKEIISEVITEVPLEIAGGSDDAGIGTSFDKIAEAIQRADEGKGVLVFYDLGSAKMNAELVIEMHGHEHVKIVEAPLVEGSYVGAVESNMGKGLEEIIISIQKSFPQPQNE